MKVLLTGASSFTGFWFARGLAAAGATVIAPLRGKPDTYSDVRGQRVAALSGVADLRSDVAFGDDKFLDIVSSEDIDVFCHHAAAVENYRSADFDVTAALASNTASFKRVAELLASRGTRGVVLTGSVFEPDAGAGTTPLRAFSPYGLSKALTSQVVAYQCEQAALPFFKFVIANPFGPFEEPRFCGYLMRMWRAGQVPEVKTPLYVRDNIHVSLLTRAYVNYVHKVASSDAMSVFAPSGYVETQGTFASRFAREMSARLKLDCPVEFAEQTDFSEPLVRINTDMVDAKRLDWSEGLAWDELASYYT